MNRNKLNEHSYLYKSIQRARKKEQRIDTIETLQAMFLFGILMVDTIMMLVLFGK